MKQWCHTKGQWVSKKVMREVEKLVKLVYSLRGEKPVKGQSFCVFADWGKFVAGSVHWGMGFYIVVPVWLRIFLIKWNSWNAAGYVEIKWEKTIICLKPTAVGDWFRLSEWNNWKFYSIHSRIGEEDAIWLQYCHYSWVVNLYAILAI